MKDTNDEQTLDMFNQHVKDNPIKEADIEAYLVKRVERLGGIAYKFTSPQRRNVPDRLVLLPKYWVCFVECKAPGKTPTDGQLREHQRLAALGHSVAVVDSYDAIDTVLDVYVRARSM